MTSYFDPTDSIADWKIKYKKVTLYSMNLLEIFHTSGAMKCVTFNVACRLNFSFLIIGIVINFLFRSCYLNLTHKEILYLNRLRKVC